VPDESLCQQLAETIIYRYITLSRYQHYLSHYLRREYNISGQQLSVLWRLVESGPCSVGEISQFLHIRDGTTSPLLDRMEEAATSVAGAATRMPGG
jgi:DNA-binding MarR family transcriptional regulator